MLQAAAMAETGQVFVMDMGEPVKIADLARELIHLSGHTEAEIGIMFTGLRAGEKLFEELLADADQTLATGVERLRVARLQVADGPAAVQEALPALSNGQLDDAGARDWLRRLVPEFTPTR